MSVYPLVRPARIAMVMRRRCMMMVPKGFWFLSMEETGQAITLKVKHAAQLLYAETLNAARLAGSF